MTLSVSRLYTVNDRMVNKYEQLVEWKLEGETEVLKENAPSATVSTINPMIRPGTEPKPSQWANFKELSYYMLCCDYMCPFQFIYIVSDWCLPKSQNCGIRKRSRYVSEMLNYESEFSSQIFYREYTSSAVYFQI
jgi:hypothetical protein